MKWRIAWRAIIKMKKADAIRAAIISNLSGVNRVKSRKFLAIGKAIARVIMLRMTARSVERRKFKGREIL